MTNEDRLAAMRWAAATRLQMGKGEPLERHRDQAIIDLVDKELDLATAGVLMRDASGIALAIEMQMAFERLSGLWSKEAAEEAPGQTR